MIIQAAITHSNLKQSAQILLKSYLQFLAMPTSTITDVVTLEIFAATIQ